MKIGTTMLLVCLVIQLCVLPTLLIHPNVQQTNKFPSRTKADLNLERNVPKVTLE